MIDDEVGTREFIWITVEAYRSLVSFAIATDVKRCILVFRSRCLKVDRIESRIGGVLYG